MNFVLNYVMNLLRKSLLSVKGSVVMDDHVVMNWGSIKDRPYKIWCCFVVGNHHNSNFSFARWSKDTGSWPLLWMRSYPLTRIRLKLHWSTNKHLEAKLNVYIYLLISLHISHIGPQHTGRNLSWPEAPASDKAGAGARTKTLGTHRSAAHGDVTVTVKTPVPGVSRSQGQDTRNSGHMNMTRGQWVIFRCDSICRIAPRSIKIRREHLGPAQQIWNLNQWA